MAVHKEMWEFRPEWLEYVKLTWNGKGRVNQRKEDSPQRLSFHNKAWESFEALGFPVKQVKTWVAIQMPSRGEGYCDEYPHVHYPLDGLTLVHYLEPGDKPAPLHIIEDGKVVEEIFPQRGLTVFMPNDLMHGVLHNYGEEPRIQMIATALRT